MRRIKLRHLDTLAAFMKTGSVTEAALVLHTTQPNASKSLKQLEDFAGSNSLNGSPGDCAQHRRQSCYFHTPRASWMS